jgi:1-acyl-sn-glycerol-3-phosphate acyltransferase
VPIVPVGIGGSERAMPKGAKFIRPRKVHVVIGKPIEASTDATSPKDQRDAARQLTVELHIELQRLFDIAQARVL